MTRTHRRDVADDGKPHPPKSGWEEPSSSARTQSGFRAVRQRRRVVRRSQHRSDRVALGSNFPDPPELVHESTIRTAFRSLIRPSQRSRTGMCPFGTGDDAKKFIDQIFCTPQIMFPPVDRLHRRHQSGACLANQRRRWDLARQHHHRPLSMCAGATHRPGGDAEFPLRW